MNWVCKRKLPPTDTIKYNNQLCNTMENLQEALYESYNLAIHYLVNHDILRELQPASTQTWDKFTEQEFRDTLKKCKNNSIPDLDHISQRHLKKILVHNKYMSNTLNITNVCFELGYWPSYFKQLALVIIPKPNKKKYDSPKLF